MTEGEEGKRAADQKGQSELETLKLQNADHPRMGAKLKLDFIDGRCPKPIENTPDFEQWQRVDCMVVSWLLNSINKEIVEALIYKTSSRDLWLELEARFGESNVPLLYEIQGEISSMTQADL
ncbi:UNVERIFIED_CONTAM: hypothetical protein Slati_0110800 [Sesamum latifolium]|uniref:Retrotransposon Copia-like N-terminal domain-containing protein n=1 Tax=Sesamum latifolium TaxID=2727402 RepID=A0AAW2Y9W1_9LAMI